MTNPFQKFTQNLISFKTDSKKNRFSQTKCYTDIIKSLLKFSIKGIINSVFSRVKSFFRKNPLINFFFLANITLTSKKRKSFLFMNRSCRQGAFTIVELLVVVSILGIISTLTIPVARDALLRARITAVQSNMVQISKAVDAFAVDKGYYPHGSDQPPTQFLTNYDALAALAPLLGTYLPNNSSILTDIFTQQAVAEINESIAFDPGIPDLFGYGYYDYVHFMVPPNKARYAYSLISFGPDGHDSSLGLRPLPGIGDRFQDAAYHPSNGLLSEGDLGCFGGNCGMPRLIPSK